MSDNSSPGGTPAPAGAVADWAIFGDELKVVDTNVEHELLEPYASFRDAPINAISELGLHFLGTAWRSYDQIIGQPIFYPGFTENIKSLTMAQPRLKSKIRSLATKRVEVEVKEGQYGGVAATGEEPAVKAARNTRRKQIESELSTVADDWLDKLVCKMEGRYFIRGAYYLATQLLTRAYHQGIHVNSQEVLQLRTVAKQAAKLKQSIVFLPSHRSHVDYVSLQVICFRLGMALPTVVAGDNLNFPVIGSFLQNAGAMYIRRSFGDDQLYSTLVQTYIDTLMQNGHNVECFVEGGRSRTGKLLQPKFGILGFYLDSVLSGIVEDAWICPVSTQYDKVIEVDSYISELLGQPKKKEDLAGFLSASNVLSLKLGRVDVRFQKPWSLRQFINDQASRLVKDQPTTPKVLMQPNIRRPILSKLGYQVLAEINEVSVVMPTALVGTVLLTLSGRSVGRAELVRRVAWLGARIVSEQGRLAHFNGNTVESVVDKALEVLGPKLVGRVDDLPEEMYYAEDRFQLSFYRNMTIHLFISQALVCAAVYTKVKHSINETISARELYDYVNFLSQLFRTEFIFPATSLEDNFRRTLEGLVADRVLYTTPDPANPESIATIELHPDERARGLENFDFYCFLIWPFIEASWLDGISLFMLSPPPTSPDQSVYLDLSTFQEKAQLLGKTLFHRGDLSYYEAVNKEALKNALGRTEEEGIVQITRPDKSEGGKIPQRIRLHPDWLPPRDALGKLTPNAVVGSRLFAYCEAIHSSRRVNGETHKDGGASLTTRVLQLAEMVAGDDLFETAVAEPLGTPKVLRRRVGIRTGRGANGKASRL